LPSPAEASTGTWRWSGVEGGSFSDEERRMIIPTSIVVLSTHAPSRTMIAKNPSLVIPAVLLRL
jgi:hypothetical protein